MLVQDEVKQFLSNYKIGDCLTTQQIKAGVKRMFGRTEGSVIPSDYCYNITNLGYGIKYFKNGFPRLLEQVERGLYRYLGENYNYSGVITHKDRLVGKWVQGKYTFTKELLP